MTAKHLVSGLSRQVTFQDSPYRLTELRKKDARAEVEALRAKSGATRPEQDEGDRKLAQAMLARGEKALLRFSGDPALRTRAEEALAALGEVLRDGSGNVADCTDAVSDAILDLTE